MRELNLLDFVHKPDINQMLRDGVLKEDDIKVKECVTDTGAYHYFYGSPQPVGPKDNEIWYWGEYYDMEHAIQECAERWNEPYGGPNVLSNEFDGEKWIITFDDNVAEMGSKDLGGDSYILYPLFANYTNDGWNVPCHVNKVQLGNKVTCLNGSVFDGVEELTEIVLPNSLTKIGNTCESICGLEHETHYEVTVIFEGTKAEWSDIEKGGYEDGEGWSWEDGSVKEIICTDVY